MEHGRRAGDDVAIVGGVDGMEEGFVGEDHEWPRLEAGGEHVPGIGVVGRLRHRRRHGDDGPLANAMLEDRREAVAIGHHRDRRVDRAVRRGPVGRVDRFEFPQPLDGKILPGNGVADPAERAENRVIEVRRGEKIVFAGVAPHADDPPAEELPRRVGVKSPGISGTWPEPDDEPTAAGHPLPEEVERAGRQRRRIGQHHPLVAVPRGGIELADVDEGGVEPPLARLPQRRRGDRLEEESPGVGGRLRGGDEDLRRRADLDSEKSRVVRLHVVRSIEHDAPLPHPRFEPGDLELHLPALPFLPGHRLDRPPRVPPVGTEHLHCNGAIRVGAAAPRLDGQPQRQTSGRLVGRQIDRLEGEILCSLGTDVDPENGGVGIGRDEVGRGSPLPRPLRAVGEDDHLVPQIGHRSEETEALLHRGRQRL